MMVYFLYLPSTAGPLCSSAEESKPMKHPTALTLIKEHGMLVLSPLLVSKSFPNL